MAVGWTFIFRQPCLLRPGLFWRGCGFSARAIDQPAAYQGFGGARLADVGCSFHAAGIGAPYPDVDFDAQLIARNHRATELGPLNPGEQYQFALAVFYLREQ